MLLKIGKNSFYRKIKAVIKNIDIRYSPAIIKIYIATLRKLMANKNITIDELAVMVQKGFDKTATNADMDFRFEQVDKRFNQIDKRFDKIERLILEDHKRRIEKIEDELKEIKGTLALILK